MKIFFGLFIVLWAHVSVAHTGHEHPVGGMGVVSEAYLNSSIDVLTGVGTYKDISVTSSLPNGSKKDLALTYTKQGITLHHAFQWEDAVRSFQEALKQDPNMARAYTGLIASYMSLARPNDSLDFISIYLQKAADSAKKISNNEVDRLWVDAYAIFYGAQYNAQVPEKVSQVGKTLSGGAMAQLTTLMEELIKTHKDPEAYAFYGWDLQNTQVLDAGIQLFPKHSGLLHYLTHVNENTGKYAAAADYAQRTITEAPDAPHLLHMYGHVLPLLGNWAEANKYFLRTHCIHRAVLRLPDDLCANITVNAPMSDATPKPTELWHYAHNLDLFGFSLMRTRDLVTAEKIFKDMCQIGNCTTVIQFYLGEEQFDKALTAVDNLLVANSALSPQLLHFKIQALIANKDVSSAQKILATSPLSTKGLEPLATQLALAFATQSMNTNLSQGLDSFLFQATQSPNFDTWSHQLPILRKLYRFADIYGAAEKDLIFDAIQKIDPGHPL